MYLNCKSLAFSPKLKWLTLTWDVFKFIYEFISNSICYRLTLTWDVFKFKAKSKKADDVIGLTLTWDVFKFCYMMENYVHY